PVGVRNGDAGAVEKLTEGLLLGGFAMQAAQSSRPASGAEHQFSHLWDMEHATDASHGFNVGVATVAVARFYEELIELPLQQLDVDAACEAWLTWDQCCADIEKQFRSAGIREVAMSESRTKYA